MIMFKQRRQREQSVPNPIADMEQFYLNQYFNSQTNGFAPYGPPHQSVHPHANQTRNRFPPIEFARMHQLELRIARIEQYLGLTTTEPSPNSGIR